MIMFAAILLSQLGDIVISRIKGDKAGQRRCRLTEFYQKKYVDVKRLKIFV